MPYTDPPRLSPSAIIRLKNMSAATARPTASLLPGSTSYLMKHRLTRPSEDLELPRERQLREWRSFWKQRETERSSWSRLEDMRDEVELKLKQEIKGPFAINNINIFNQNSPTEFMFDEEFSNSRCLPSEWEIVAANFPIETPKRFSMPIRVEKVLMLDHKNILVGIVATANLAYQKQVVARFTLDHWKTTSEVVAKYNNNGGREKQLAGYDRFDFNINLSDLGNLEVKTLFFCVRYAVNGVEYWDNNDSTNFQVDFKRKRKPQNAIGQVLHLRAPQVCPVDRLLGLPGQKYNISNGITDLREAAKSCNICSMILSSIEQQSDSDLKKITLLIEPNFWAMERSSMESQLICIPKLIVYPGSLVTSTGFRKEFSILAEPGSNFQIAMVSEWIRVCDQNHHHAESPFVKLPTRLIEIGYHENPNSLRLRITTGPEQGRYIALSHRWEKDLEQFQTTKSNIAARCDKIEFDDLSKAFKDAVIITRKLGLRFLWIDSFCIIQDDINDWERESKRMEEVFASAYCTIAATSARAGTGFLRRSDEQCIRLGNTSRHVYVSKTGTNFDHDVEKAELNQRGWVLQERALSRRTIHFTAAQTYWECGSSIWSETSNQNFKPSNFLSSSEFPNFDLPDARLEERLVFQDVFTKYSKLGLTKETDRPIAIAGLEYRLATYYKTESVYGIVRSFFGESLLWQRSGSMLMKPLTNFNDEISSWSVEHEKVPSWSWMGYGGEIRYMDIPQDGLRWKSDVNFMYTEENMCTLLAPLARISSTCCLKFYENMSCMVRDENDNLAGWIRCDTESEVNIEHIGCIRLAEANLRQRNTIDNSSCELLPGDYTYALLVTPTCPGGDDSKTYRRLGIAVIQRSHLFPSGKNVRVF